MRGGTRDVPSISEGERELALRLVHSETALAMAFARWAAAARSEHPRVALEPEVFAEHVARLVLRSELKPMDLVQLDAADVFLAAGCTRQDAAALALFEAKYLQPLRCFVDEIDSNPARLDELKQMLRERLLVAER